MVKGIYVPYTYQYVPGYRVFPHGVYTNWLETGALDSYYALGNLSCCSASAPSGGWGDEDNFRETAYVANAYRIAYKAVAFQKYW